MSSFFMSMRDLITPNKMIIRKFLINDKKKHPFAILLPGGGYQNVWAGVEGDDYAKRLNELGINCFIVYYHVRGKAQYPRPLDDVACALEKILAKKDKYNLLDNYALVGSSAGGHLAGMFAREDIGYKKYNLPKPNAVILAYPVVTLTTPTHIGTRDNIVGKNKLEDMVELLSLEKHITNDFPKTYFFCGKNDMLVDHNGSLMLQQAFDKEGINYIFHHYDDLPHGVGVADNTMASGWIKEAVDFWLK